MGFTFVSLNIIDETAKEMRNVRAVGLAQKMHGLVRPLERLSGDILMDVIRKARIEVIDGWDDRFDREIYTREGHSELVRAFVPLLSRGRSIGILEAGYNRRERPVITAEEIRLLNGLAEQTAITVENTRLLQQLNDERELLHTLMDNIPDAIYFKDKKSRFIRASMALARKIGLSDPAHLIGKTDFDVFTKEHAQQAFEDEQRILRTALPEIGIEEKETWPDARVTWVSTTKMPLRDTKGGIIGTFGVSRDITKRKAMEDALRFRLKFEEHITSLSSKFINLDLRQIDEAIHDALRVLGGFTASDRCVVLLLDDKRTALERRYEWCGDGVDSFMESKHRSVDLLSHEWLRDTVKNGNSVIAQRLDELPETAQREKTILREMGVKSLLYVPLIYSGSLAGIIGIETVRGEKTWPEDTTTLLTIVGEVFMSAFSRKWAEEKLQHANNVLELRVTERTADLEKANDLLKTRIEQLNFLNTSVYELSPIVTTDKLLPVILTVFMGRFPEAQGGLCLRSGDRFHCMCTTAALGSDDNRFCLEQSARLLADSVLLRPIFIEDRTADERMSRLSWTGIDDLVCVAAIPLVVDSSCKVLLHILCRRECAGNFELELTLLTTLAAHAAICLSNALHYQERAEKARLDGELDAARSIQRRFTPQHRPDIPHVNLMGVYYPAYEVGGDYLDYFQTEAGDWVVAVADVCGKGIPAALLMTTMRSAFRVEAKNETSARRLLCSVNKFMALSLDDKSFVTALCLIIKGDGSSMSYARAGHPMLLKLDRGGGVPQAVGCGGIALGLMRDTDPFAGMMEEKIIPLVAGDRYIIYTDGLIDASDPQKNAYGFARLQMLLSRDRDSDPQRLIGALMNDINSFSRGTAYSDDLTILALQVY
jgi:PAS domain S-box-containing protein